MADTVLEFGILNIKASPHPGGIYPRLLKSIANKPVVLWGDDVFALKPPTKQEGGYFLGRFWVWTEVDPSKPAINKERLEELSHDDAESTLRTDIGLNLRVFLYMLRERDHLIFYEFKNEFGQHLGQKRLVKALQKLFLRTNAKGEMRVDVDVVPEEDALDKILSIPILTKLEIDLKKPNADDNTSAFAEVMRELEEQGLKEKQTTYLAASRKKGIKPNAQTRKEAEVAATNGNVRGVGKGKKAGEKFDLSTEEYPKVITLILDNITSATAAILRVAKSASVGRRRPSGPPT